MSLARQEYVAGKIIRQLGVDPLKSSNMTAGCTEGLDMRSGRQCIKIVKVLGQAKIVVQPSGLWRLRLTSIKTSTIANHTVGILRIG